MLEETGNYFQRYSMVDHFVTHAVPHYGDKPADRAVMESKAPMVGLYDVKWDPIKQSPWTISKSMVVPFITLKTKLPSLENRPNKIFVVMSVKNDFMATKSAKLRTQIQDALNKIPGSKVDIIIRGDLEQFQQMIDNLAENMANSTFCVVPPGDAPSSKRLYDAISALCIPIIFANRFTLPYDGLFVDYEKISLQIPSKEVETLPEVIASINDDEIKQMQTELIQIRKKFTYDYRNPPHDGEGVWTMCWNIYFRHKMLKPYLNNEMTGFDSDPPSKIP
jgi:hypothetical protein